MIETEKHASGQRACLDENEIANLLEGGLPEGDRARVNVHLDTCPACRALVAGAASTPSVDRADTPNLDAPLRASASVHPGARIARYVILGAVGVGGMGIVYAAYDPELDRKVAVKVLRPGATPSSDAQQRRILREAQSMARLTHPNVVAIYDVGVVSGQIFIVMELVKGTTLRRWLAEQPRSWREAVDILRRAAQGLAAAHAAGLVHRDFKPDNVLIGEDGRVLVADFGLARSLGPGEGEGSSREGAAEPSSVDERLTRTGTVAGTPGYMAPEQIAGLAVDARSDVFSFCVALHEALHGERPFAGETPREIRDAVLAGQVRGPSSKVRVPAAIQRIVVAGLRAEPERRPASMKEIIEALGRDPATTRRRAAFAATLVLLAAALALVLVRRVSPPSTACQGASRKLVGVWDAERKKAVSSALLATEKSWAEPTWRIVEGALDRYARDWVTMRTEACEATQINHEQSEALLDARMRCLDDRLEEVRAVAEILSKPDEKLITTAARAAQSVSPLRGCADAAALLAPIPLPSDPSVRAAVEVLRPELAKAKALRAAARYHEGEAVAADLVVQARRLGYDPLLAEALQTWAEFLHLNAKHGPDTEALRDALWAAESGRDRKRAASILTELVAQVAAQGARNDAAHEYARHAAALLRGIGGDAEIEAALADHLGTLLDEEGHHAEGEKLCREAIEKRKAVFGAEAPQYGVSLANLGVSLSMQDRHAEALALGEQALAVYQKALGEHHPLYGAVLFNIASALRQLDRLDEARTRADRALALLEEAVGPEHTLIAGAEHNVGLVANAQHRYADAEAHLARAVALNIKLRGPEHYYVANYLSTLAEAQQAQGHLTEAIASYRRALAIYVKGGENDLLIARARSALGAILLQAKAPAAARQELESALAVQEAKEPLKRALAGTQINLAIALWSTGDKARARRMGALAVQGYVESGPEAKDDLAEARKWLASVDPHLPR